MSGFLDKCDIVIEIYGILYMAFWTNQNFYKLSYVCKLPSILEGNGPYIATCHKYMTRNRRLCDILPSEMGTQFLKWVEYLKNLSIVKNILKASRQIGVQLVEFKQILA